MTSETDVNGASRRPNVLLETIVGQLGRAMNKMQVQQKGVLHNTPNFCVPNTIEPKSSCTATQESHPQPGGSLTTMDNVTVDPSEQVRPFCQSRLWTQLHALTASFPSCRLP